MSNQAENLDQEIPTNPRPKTIGLVQITRIGDVLQTYHAIKNFKEVNEGYRFVLIARKKFAYPLDSLLRTIFDNIHYLDIKELSNGVTDVASFNSSIKGFVERINLENINVLINLSFSKSSAFLSGLITSDHKLGLKSDNRAETHITDPWSQYIYSTVMGGALNPFNLIDLFGFLIGGKRTTNINEPKESKSKKVVIHPFASNSKKHWSAKKWVEVIFRFLKDTDDSIVQIVGAANESAQAQIIASDPILNRYKSRIENKAGKTTIPELFDILADAKLFIGHDSMIGHIAAIAKTKTITISLGTVRAQETSPYIKDGITLSPKTKCYPCFPDDKCDLYQCHADVPYQVVSDVLKLSFKQSSLTHKDLKNNLSSFHLNSCHVYRTDFSENGLFFLEDLNDDYLQAQDVIRLFYRISFLFMFAQEEENYPYPELNVKTLAELQHYQGGIQQIFELSEFGMKYSKFILEEISKETPNLNEIKAFSKKIDEIDHLMNLVKNAFPLLAPLIDLSTTAKSNLAGENIVQLSEHNFLACNETSKLCQVIYELMNKTITEHQIQKGSTLKPE